MLGELAPADRLKELLASRWAERDAAGGRGTEVHKIAHRLHLGEEAAYPGELAGHVEAHRDFLDTLEPKIIAAELILGNRSVRYCGTLDLVADLDPVPWDGQLIPAARWLLDVKTARLGISARDRATARRVRARRGIHRRGRRRAADELARD